MKRQTKEKENISIFGIKIRGDIFVMLIIFLIGLLLYSVKTYKLDHGKTEVVYAKIIDVGITKQAGRRASKIAYVKFRYNLNGKDATHFLHFFQLEETLEQYHIGDCIEVLVSLENENFWKWNESKGSFKCN